MENVERKEACELYMRRGWSIQKIAKELHHSDSTIFLALKDAGVTFRKRGRPKGWKKDKMIIPSVPEEYARASAKINDGNKIARHVAEMLFDEPKPETGLDSYLAEASEGLNILISLGMCLVAFPTWCVYQLNKAITEARR